MKSNRSVISGFISSGRKAKRELDYNSRDAIAISEKALLSIVSDNKDTEFGRAHEFASIKSIDDYKEKVPISTYDDFESKIRRMYEGGQKDILTAYPITFYAKTSGTMGVPKYIPVSSLEIERYTRFSTELAFAVAEEYYRNTLEKGLKVGYGINLIDLNTEVSENGMPMGPISAVVLDKVKSISESMFTVPWELMRHEEDRDIKYLMARFSLENRDVAFISSTFITAVVDLVDYIRDNWEMLCVDIHHGRINKEIKLSEELRERLERNIRPNPKRAKEISQEIKKGSYEIVPRLWPDIQFIAGVGTGSFMTYYKKMYHYAGKKVPFNNLVYAASEGLFATARRMGDTSYVLVPQGGFYEFIPTDSKDDKTLTIDQVEQGIDYEIVVTNLSGLYRYKMDDVVRVTGFYNEAPLIKFLYRKNQGLSLVGENTSIDDVRWSIERFMIDTGLTVVDFSLYGNTEEKPVCYDMFIELDEKLGEKDLQECRDILETRLMQANLTYGNKLRLGKLGPMRLIQVQNQTYQLYRDMQIMQGASANQLKPVNVLDTPLKYNFFSALREE